MYTLPTCTHRNPFPFSILIHTFTSALCSVLCVYLNKVYWGWRRYQSALWIFKRPALVIETFNLLSPPTHHHHPTVCLVYRSETPHTLWCPAALALASERVIQIDGVDIEVAREWVGLRVAWWPGRLINWRESTCVCVCLRTQSIYVCV